MEIRFSQLKNDLLHQQNTLFDIFDYIQELRDGTQRHFILKKFFWKSADLFTFHVNQLTLYLPASKLSTDDELYTRADQLEYDPDLCQHTFRSEPKKPRQHLPRDHSYFMGDPLTFSLITLTNRRMDAQARLVLLIIETLTLMLRESEIFTCRMTCLKSDNGSIVRELITLLVERPVSIDPLSHSEQRLAEELTVRCLGLLYELLVAAQQSSWSDERGSFFTVRWIVDIIEQLDHHHLENYVDDIVRQALVLISTKNDPCSSLVELLQQSDLEPEEVIVIFHQFFILDTLTYHSDSILTLLQDSYFEEFKFYVQIPVVEKKLSHHYLLSSWTLKLIESVIERIHNVRARFPRSLSVRATVPHA